jgi:hypothetical protein
MLSLQLWLCLLIAEFTIGFTRTRVRIPRDIFALPPRGAFTIILVWLFRVLIRAPNRHETALLHDRLLSSSSCWLESRLPSETIKRAAYP